MTAMRASITPGVRKTRCLFALEMLRFIRARQALVVHVAAAEACAGVGVVPPDEPPMPLHSSATRPNASTRPGQPSSAASLASALLKFFTHVTAFSLASSRAFPLSWHISRGGKCKLHITSRIAARTSGTDAMATLLDLPQLRFMTAMHAWRRALGLAAPAVWTLPPPAPIPPTTGESGPLEPALTVTKGPPLAATARVCSSPGQPIKWASDSSVAVRLRTASTAYSRAGHPGPVSDDSHSAGEQEPTHRPPAAAAAAAAPPPWPKRWAGSGGLTTIRQSHSSILPLLATATLRADILA
mmetsp:Transcript_6097/g.17836  ORF Transcript_6097/g.17836 Transcript_6097/m.17836 type:complete len:299 (+) Transcript_6097:2086-2982(+)